MTNAERRVAEVVLANPQLVAFGTVADLAEGAGSGAATVVRLATKLGFEGFSALQASVQQDLANQLRPAAERIRDPAVHDSLNRHLQIELGNVQITLGVIDQVALADVIDHLADPARRIYVLSGDASKGVAAQFVGDLDALRANVTMIEGNDVAVRRTVALMDEGDVLVTVDLRRYDRWLVDAARTAAHAGVWTVSIADSVLSPVAACAQRTLVVTAAGAGPFDSHVGTLALMNLLVAGAAIRLRGVATERLDRAEAAWRVSNALTER
ncbi:MAG: MurR/RpiR family transcriptional regulator [Actinomycetota bacterium]|nr:MurR/RpiR family transcriptional regulator [Actinomycetota bacterium]